MITAKKQCKGERKVEYIISTPSLHFPLFLDSEFINRYSLRSDAFERPLVTCYNDFDRYLEALIDHGLQHDEANFILAKTARWKNYSSKNIRVCDPVD